MIFSKYITAEPFGKQGSSTFALQMPAASACLPFLAVRVKHICSANASRKRLSAFLGSAGQAHLLRKCQPQAAVCLSWQCGSSTFALQMPALSDSHGLENAIFQCYLQTECVSIQTNREFPDKCQWNSLCFLFSHEKRMKETETSPKTSFHQFLHNRLLQADV